MIDGLWWGLSWHGCGVGVGEREKGVVDYPYISEELGRERHLGADSKWKVGVPAARWDWIMVQVRVQVSCLNLGDKGGGRLPLTFLRLPQEF